MFAIYNSDVGKQNTWKAACPPVSEGLTLQTKERRLLSAGGTRPAPTGVERRNANVRYIFGLDPDRYLHCRSRWIVLHNLREKKIAATTAIVTAVTM